MASADTVSGAVPTPPRPRRTQEERGRETRERLLRATVECLIEEGYKRTTVTRVTERAGTSLGAQQHHFPTKAELVTSAVEFLAEARIEEIRERVARLDDASATRATAVLDLVWETLSGRLNVATRELWVAARTDAGLLEALLPVERRSGRAVRELFRDLLDRPPDPVALDLCVDVMRGLALRQVLLGEAETQAVWRRYRPVVERLLDVRSEG